MEIDALWEMRFKEAQTRAFKPRQIVWKTIERINLEPTSLCNASCIICDHDNYVEWGGKREIPLDDAISFLDRVKAVFSNIKQINFGVYCEPLMYPHISDLIRHARKISSHVRISTNLSLLDEQMSKELLDAGLTDICFSIDECNETRFEKIRKGIKWKTVLRNAYEFKFLRDHERYNCKISISPVLCNENKMWMNEIIRFWTPISDMHIIPSPEIPIGTLINRVEPWFDTTGKPMCLDMFTIKASGNVVPCCRDIYEETTLGNLYKNSVKDIYDGESLKILRKNLSTLTNIPHCCKICTYLPQFQNRQITFLEKVKGTYNLVKTHMNNRIGKSTNYGEQLI